jgi:hypothetical protein
MSKQKIYGSIVTIILSGSTLFAVPFVYAQTPGGQPRMNFFQEFIQFFSQKFGLDKTQVQTALTDYQNQRKATITPRPTITPDQLSARDKTRLDQLVTAGKITGDQETAILNELSALRIKYNPNTLKNETAKERKTQGTAMRDEVVSWAKSQGIDSSYVMPGFGYGRGMMGNKMGGKGFFRGDKNENNESVKDQ